MSFNIVGTVYDAVTVKPIPGATVTDNENPENSYSCDSDGGFNLLVTDDITMVTFSAPGYTSFTTDAGGVMATSQSDGVINLTPANATPAQVAVITVKQNIGLILILAVLVFVLWRYNKSLLAMLK